MGIMFKLLQKKNFMISTNTVNNYLDCKYLAILNIILGNIDPIQVYKSLQSIQEKKIAKFVDWVSPSIQVAISKGSPFSQLKNQLSGLSLANHTSFRFYLMLIVYNLLLSIINFYFSIVFYQIFCL